MGLGSMVKILDPALADFWDLGFRGLGFRVSWLCSGFRV